MVTLLPKNFRFKRPSKLTRKSPELQQIVECLTLIAGGNVEHAGTSSAVRGNSGVTRIQAIQLLRTAIDSSPPNHFLLEVTEGQQRILINVLTNLLSDQETQVRREAVETLGSLIESPFRDEIVNVLSPMAIKESDSQTAITAIRVLVKAGLDAASIAVPTLCKVAQKHKDPKARQEACDTLRELGEGTREVRETLVKVTTGDEDQTVRLAAGRAFLGLYKLQVVVEELSKHTFRLPRLIDDLRAGGEEFRQLRRNVQPADQTTKPASEPRSMSDVPARPGASKPRMTKDEAYVMALRLSRTDPVALPVALNVAVCSVPPCPELSAIGSETRERDNSEKPR